MSLSSRKMSQETAVIKEKYQLMKVIDETTPDFPYQLILMYLSSGCPLSEVVDDLSRLLVPEMKTIITGDFNFDKDEENSLSIYLRNGNFEQKVSWPTHCQGRTIDHCYTNTRVKLIRHSPYFSDHSALCIEFEDL